MKLSFLTLKLGCALISGAILSTSIFAEELLSDQDLYADPNPQSAVTGKAKKGKVDLVGKKGFWVQIKAGGTVGWTKLSNVQVETSSGGLSTLSTGRQGGGNIVSTSGVRGLDGGDLEKAQPDLREFEKLTSLKESKDKGDEFAKAGGLSTRKIGYVQPPAQSSTTGSNSPFNSN